MGAAGRALTAVSISMLALFAAPSALAVVDGPIVIDHCAGPGQGITGLCSIEPNGTRLHQLTNGNETDPATSPDGRSLAFSCGPYATVTGGICVMGPHGVRALTQVGADPTWSPDGTQIAFDSCQHGGIDGGICTVAVDTGTVHRLTSNSNDNWPAWSPDGSQIAFAIETPADPSQGIYVMGADGSHPRHLVQIVADKPAWSPDGRQIAYDHGFDGIWVMNADGSGNHQLVDPSYGFIDPAWSPDGGTIVGVSGPPFYLYRVSAGGGTPTPIGHAEGQDPTWGVAPVSSVTTGPVKNVQGAGATLTGSVDPAGLSGTYSFQYGTSGSYGHSTPVRALKATSRSIDVAEAINSLQDGTLYHYRLTATTANGTGYGQDRTFIAGVGPPIPTCGDHEVKVSEAVTADASCFHHRGNTYTAEGQVRVNGLDLFPAGGKITVQPDAHRITATGDGLIAVSGFPVDVWTGGLDLPVDQPLNFSLVGAGKLKNPRKAGQFFGFPLDNQISAHFTPDDGAEIDGTVALKPLGDDVSASITIATDKDGLKTAEISLSKSGVRHQGNRCNPDKTIPVGFECVQNGKRWSLAPGGNAVAKFAGRLPVTNLTLSYSRAEGVAEWAGQAELSLKDVLGVEKGLPTVTVGFGVTFSPPYINQLTLGASDFSIPLFGDVQLTSIEGSVRFRPHFEFDGKAGFAAGAKVGSTRLLGIDGEVKVEFPKNAFHARVSGTVNVLDKVQLGDGYFDIMTKDGTWTLGLGGHAGFSYGPVSAQASVSGAVTFFPLHFQVLGNAQLGAFGQTLGGQLIISDAGAGACGHINVLFYSGDVGFEVHWSPFQVQFQGCDFSGLYTIGGASDRRAGTAAAAGQTTIVGPGTKQIELGAVGASAPPAVTLYGPGGIAVPAPVGTPNRIVVGPHGLALADTGSRTSLFIVQHPSPGRWAVVPNPGTTPPVRYLRANPIHPVAIQARVLGRGHSRTLVWRMNAQPGLNVTYVDRGPFDSRQITSTGRGRGRLRFTPAPGPAGRRTIVAVVSVDGIVREQLTVAHYMAPAPAVSRVSGARFTVRHHKLIVRWRRAPGAIVYEIDVRLSTGPVRWLTATTSATIPLPRAARVLRVSIRTQQAGTPGPAVVATRSR